VDHDTTDGSPARDTVSDRVMDLSPEGDGYLGTISFDVAAG
jgi:hypothetical protein